MKNWRACILICAVLLFFWGCATEIKTESKLPSPAYYSELHPSESIGLGDFDIDIEQLVSQSLGRIFYFYNIGDICGDNEERIVQGSAVAIDKNHALSNYHVLGGKTIGEIKIYFSNKEETHAFGAEVEKYDKIKDLVLLRLDKEIPWQVASLGEEIRFGEKIYFGGYSGGFPLPTIRVTFMSSLNYEYGIYLDPLYYGNSGGGVFDSQGRLIGIIYLMFSINSTPTFRGYAIPVDKIKEFLNIE